jgi:hypothetical protein
MADRRFVVASQLRIEQPRSGSIDVAGVLRVAYDATKVAPLDILIVGGDEVPRLYQALTSRSTRFTSQVFLWYPTLSDYPGMEPDHLVVNHQGVPCQGWGAAEGEVGETFKFACPNNPAAQAATLQALEHLLTTYDFDGVFLDKIRFPSPANGFDQVLSCFCPHCRRTASEQGLDLDEVQEALHSLSARRAHTDAEGSIPIPPGAPWLDDLLADQPLLRRFIRFRADSITRLVEDIHRLTKRLGKQISLDLFSPGLAPLVGQDYTALAPYGVWGKPMIYRYSKGPAGLRGEVPSLADGLQSFLGYDPDQALSWLQERVSAMAGTTFQQIDADGPPVSLIADETRRAVELMGDVPVYLGVEAVSIPEFNISITPGHVRDMVAVAHDTGAGGVVLSWDLMHTPLDNLRALEAPHER